MSATAVDGVLVVGGGYAGVHAARAVIRGGHRAVIVDPTGEHDFVTRLAAVAGGTGSKLDASVPLSDFTRDLIMGVVTTVDDGAITLDDGRVYTADAVIVTAGAVPTTPPIPGIEHATALRTADDALDLRGRIAAAGSVVVIGGGATGVQLAGTTAARHRRTSVTVVEADDSLLAAMGSSISDGAERILRERGVRLVLGSRVDEIDSMAVLVDDEWIEGLVVWAAGFTPRAEALGLPVMESGRVDVDDTLLVSGWSRTFAAGDVAGHRDANGEELAMSAQIAVQAGDAAGDNAVRLLCGEGLRRVALEHRGWVLDLGGNRGLAEFGPLSFSTPFLDLIPPLLHWGIDVKHLLETRGIDGIVDRPR